MKFGLALTLSHQLTLTPQLQQAIRLLQLSNVELEAEIQAQIEQNPLLECIDDEQFIAQQQQDDALSQVDLDVKREDATIPEQLSVDVEWSELYNLPQSLAVHQETQNYDDWVTLPPDYKQALREQVDLLKFSQIEKYIAYHIIDAIDERGFLEPSLTELCESIEQVLGDMGCDDECCHQRIERVLREIHLLEPLGVASRSLIEFFIIQLKEKWQQSKETLYHDALLILQHEQVFIQQDLKKLMKLTQLNQERITQAIHCLKSLKKQPFAGSNYEQVEYQTPDVIVERAGQAWRVRLNREHLPRLGIQSYYQNLLKNTAYEQHHSYLKQHLADAKSFIKNVDERHKTILRVAQCIVQHQQAFLQQGRQGLKPLVMRAVAEELGLHESTISRAIMNKYMFTPQGLMEFRSFFSSQVGAVDGDDHYAATAVQEMIKQMIAQENKRKPLSDQAIVELLEQQQGVKIARRTVAKYREALNIAPSSQRKVLF
ncbi:MAG: RNA polymerase factor sigma-54 [Acinetobacter sp.]|nr:RNA polymerase factor sigma-54 [Acinetobacter sp.]